MKRILVALSMLFTAATFCPTLSDAASVIITTPGYYPGGYYYGPYGYGYRYYPRPYWRGRHWRHHHWYYYR